MKTSKRFWICGWILFFLNSVCSAFITIDRYGHYNDVTTKYVALKSLETVGFWLSVLLILVFVKTVVSKFWLKRYKLKFWSLFKQFLSVSLVNLFSCLVLMYWFIGVFFSSFGQKMVRLSDLFLYFILEFILNRKFLTELIVKVRSGFRWNLSVFGIVAVSHLLFILVIWFLVRS